MRYASVKYNDTVDGIGICVSFWTQGCPHKCKGCHNPETWNPDGGKEYTIEVRDKIVKAINAHGVQRNLSILGGEPFANESKDIVLDLIQNVRKNFPFVKIFIWSGFLYEQLITDEKSKQILELSDVLIDGLFKEEEKDLSLFLRGSKNQRVINIQESMKQNVIIEYKNIDSDKKI